MTEKNPSAPPGLDVQVTYDGVVIRAAKPDVGKLTTDTLLDELSNRMASLRMVLGNLALLVERHIQDVQCQCVTACLPPCPRALLRDATFNAKKGV